MPPTARQGDIQCQVGFNNLLAIKLEYLKMLKDFISNVRQIIALEICVFKLL